jgi:hypothetical protein
MGSAPVTTLGLHVFGADYFPNTYQFNPFNISVDLMVPEPKSWEVSIKAYTKLSLPTTLDKEKYYFSYSLISYRLA